MRGAWAAVLFAAVIALASRAVRADGAPSSETDAMFAKGVEALEAGKPGEAIAQFEALADRGVVDANVSYDRGLAYAARVRIGAEQPGDLGRAAHGFEEARSLTEDKTLERDATAALGAIRNEVARRRLRSGTGTEVEPNPSVLELLVHLVSEDAWAAVAAVASLVAGISLFVRSEAKRRRLRIGATVTFAVSAPLCLVLALLAWHARDERLTVREGVVVNPNARPLDERGIVLPSANPLPAGARVRVLGVSPGSSEIQWGSLHAWIPSASVRPLARRD